MASRKSTKTPTTGPAPLVLPASRPRNRVATDPLLKKSGAHTDKRLRGKVSASAKDLSDALQSIRQTKGDEQG
jgi:hypothetical protein